MQKDCRLKLPSLVLVIFETVCMGCPATHDDHAVGCMGIYVSILHVPGGAVHMLAALCMHAVYSCIHMRKYKS